MQRPVMNLLHQNGCDVIDFAGDFAIDLATRYLAIHPNKTTTTMTTTTTGDDYHDAYDDVADFSIYTVGWMHLLKNADAEAAAGCHGI